MKTMSWICGRRTWRKGRLIFERRLGSTCEGKMGSGNVEIALFEGKRIETDLTPTMGNIAQWHDGWGCVLPSCFCGICGNDSRLGFCYFCTFIDGIYNWNILTTRLCTSTILRELLALILATGLLSCLKHTQCLSVVRCSRMTVHF